MSSEFIRVRYIERKDAIELKDLLSRFLSVDDKIKNLRDKRMKARKNGHPTRAKITTWNAKSSNLCEERHEIKEKISKLIEKNIVVTKDE